jgi:glycosyltransferase involved in cell wall biosynthesis
MKVSVIITVCNLERFIVEAIDSVLKQTYKADEIIVVDDGSTDGSLNLIESFGNCIKVFSMGKNSGVLLAFLKGLKESSGDILCFLDGDDIWMPEKLEKVINVFKNHSDAMMVTHVHEWIDEEGSSSNVIDNTHRNLKRISAMARTHNEMDRLLKNSILCYKGVWLGSAFCIQKRDLNIEEYEKWVLSYPGSELSHQDHPCQSGKENLFY